MSNISRPAPFVLLSTNHGTLIVNRNDYHQTERGAYGVGHQLFTASCFDPLEVDFALALIRYRRKYYGDGVVALDCGANIGVHSVEWAKLMYGWGSVFSFEAQEKIFYALAGNIVINNCLNATLKHCALGATCGTLEIPEPNYNVPSSYGSFELRKKNNTEFIGQQIDYARTKEIPMISIDSLNLSRIDFMKIDVEGMEEEVLDGARASIAKHTPIMMIESIKSDTKKISAFLTQHGYTHFPMGINMLAVHAADPVAKHLSVQGQALTLS